MTVLFLSLFSFFTTEKHVPNKAAFRKMLFGTPVSKKKKSSNRVHSVQNTVPVPVPPAPVPPAPNVDPVPPAPVPPAPNVDPVPPAPVPPAPNVDPVPPAPNPAVIVPMNPVVVVPAVSGAQQANPLDVNLIHGVASPVPAFGYGELVNSVVIDFLSGTEASDLQLAGINYSLVFPEGESPNQVAPVINRERATRHLQRLGAQDRPVVFLSGFQDINLIPDLPAVYKTNVYTQAAKVVAPVYNQHGVLVNQTFFLVRKA